MCAITTAGKVLNRIVLDRMKETLDSNDEAAIRLHRSSPVHIVTLSIVIEQLIDPLQLFVLSEKTFGSVRRDTLCTILSIMVYHTVCQ